MKRVLLGIISLLSVSADYAAENTPRPTVRFHEVGPSFLNKPNVLILRRQETNVLLSFSTVAASDRYDLSCTLVNADSDENITPPFTSLGSWLGLHSGNPFNHYYLHESLTTPSVSFSPAEYTVLIIVSEFTVSYGQRSATNSAMFEVIPLKAALAVL